MATEGIQIEKLLDYYPDSGNIEIHHRRLIKELYDLKEPPDFFTAGPVGRDIGHWEAKLLGPSDSPYSGGVFLLSIRFERYPFFPPESVILLWSPWNDRTGAFLEGRRPEPWSVVRLSRAFWYDFKRVNAKEAHKPTGPVVWLLACPLA